MTIIFEGQLYEVTNVHTRTNEISMRPRSGNGTMQEMRINPADPVSGPNLTITDPDRRRLEDEYRISFIYADPFLKDPIVETEL